MFMPKHMRLLQPETDEDSIGQNKVRQSFVNSMKVPEHILLATDNESLYDRSYPHEVAIDNQNLFIRNNSPIILQTPPNTLTVDNGKNPTTVDDLEGKYDLNKFRTGDPVETSQQNTGIAPTSGSLTVDQHLTLLERQVTRLNTRVYQLEDDMESVQYWQKVTICLGIILASVVVLKSVVNR